jgi:magnesium transporter
MPLRNPLLVPDLRELIQGGETAAVREFLGDLHPGQIAELVEDFDPPEDSDLLKLLEPRQRAEVLGYIDGENQVRHVEAMDPADAAAMLHVMPHDERAGLVKRLDDNIVDGILRRLAHAEREDIRRLASYEPGTAGAVMTTDYATLPPHITVREAIDRLRQEAPDRETIYYNYVVDDNRRLLGFVSLKNLFLARPRARVDEVMKTDLIVARLDEDQESVAKKVEEYDLIAIPVLDAEDRLVGIVTYDDAADILRQEQAEDLIRFGGVSPDPEADSEPYWQSSTITSVRRRIKWLLMLFVAENFTYPVFEHFKWLEGDSYFPALGFFVALLIGTGGNAGSQTVSTVIRGLALGEIDRRDVWRVLGREALTGLILGLALGATGVLYSHFYRQQPWGISLVVGLTLLCICMWANTIGSLVPLVATRFGLDPAVISAPFITTLVDATGLIIYYSIAILLLLRLGLGTG